MADNFLEKQMEDYRAGRRRNPVSHSAGRRPGIYPLKYPAQTVIVVNADNEGAEQVIAQFIAAGATVAFTANADGSAIAQRVGGRFYPGGLEQLVTDLQKRNEQPQTIIAFNIEDLQSGATKYPSVNARIFICRTQADAPPTGAACTTIAHSGNLSAVAMMAVALAHPNAAISGTITIR